MLHLGRSRPVWRPGGIGPDLIFLFFCIKAKEQKSRPAWHGTYNSWPCSVGLVPFLTQSKIKNLPLVKWQAGWEKYYPLRLRFLIGRPFLIAGHGFQYNDVRPRFLCRRQVQIELVLLGFF